MRNTGVVRRVPVAPGAGRRGRIPDRGAAGHRTSDAPADDHEPGGTTFVDALFTATSAVCVTGLTVVDTAMHWTPLGQVTILVLIQLGGLGIMIFASLIGLALARKLSVRTRLNTAAEAKAVGYEDVRGLVRGIAVISLIIELGTWALLFPRFMLGYGYTPGEAAWHALFHSVSSFNNAGFALYSNNMMDFVADPFICLPMCAAIILGGLGFPVILQLRREFTRPLHWSMNTKLVLWGTAVLLAAGTVYLTVVEWDNPDTFGRLDPAGSRASGLLCVRADPHRRLQQRRHRSHA